MTFNTLYNQKLISLALLMLWSLYFVSGAPLPQADGNSTSSTNQNNNTVDPFSTPDYLAPSDFTWEQGVYGVLFIAFGILEVLHGYKYIRFTLLLGGFLVWSSTAVMIIIIVDLSSGIYQSSEVYFALWLVAGLVGAVVSFYLWHVGIVLTGAYGAFVVVAVLFTAGNVTNYIFRYTVLVIVVIAGGYLTKRYERNAVILATSVAGAYCIMFGLDMFVQSGFRATFHVMLSQSTKGFNPVPGTWVMIGFVPVIAAFGVYWELKHHEEPVGSWWLGQGAKPLPPLPGEKPPRRCCGFLLSLPASDYKSKKLPASGSESDTTLVTPPSAAKKSLAEKIFPCLEKREKSSPKSNDTTTQNNSPSTVETNTTSNVNQTAEKSEGAGEAIIEKPIDSSITGGGSSTAPIEKGVYIGRETIGHTGAHKIVIHREEREFSLDLHEDL